MALKALNKVTPTKTSNLKLGKGPINDSKAEEEKKRLEELAGAAEAKAYANSVNIKVGDSNYNNIYGTLRDNPLGYDVTGKPNVLKTDAEKEEEEKLVKQIEERAKPENNGNIKWKKVNSKVTAEDAMASFVESREAAQAENRDSFLGASEEEKNKKADASGHLAGLRDNLNKSKGNAINLGMGAISDNRAEQLYGASGMAVSKKLAEGIGSPLAKGAPFGQQTIINKDGKIVRKTDEAKALEQQVSEVINDDNGKIKWKKTEKEKQEEFVNAFNDTLNKHRAERTTENVAFRGGLGKFDFGKVKYTSRDDIKALGEDLAKKYAEGTATDDDFKAYVEAEGAYTDRLYRSFEQKLKNNSVDYHVSAVVDRWDKTAIPESEIWKDVDAYNAEGQALVAERDALLQKYAEGTATEDDFKKFAEKQSRFAAKEAVFGSDRWQAVGTLATTEALKERTEAYKADVSQKNPYQYSLDKYTKEAEEWEQVNNPSYVRGKYSDDNPYKGLVADAERLSGNWKQEKSTHVYANAPEQLQRALNYDKILEEKDYDSKTADDRKKSGFDDYSGVFNSTKTSQNGDVAISVPVSVAYKNADEFVSAVADSDLGKAGGRSAKLAYFFDNATEEQKKNFVFLAKTKGYNDAFNYVDGIYGLIGIQAGENAAKDYANASVGEKILMGIGANIIGGLGDFEQGMRGVGKAVTGDTSYTLPLPSQAMANALMSDDVEPNQYARFGMSTLRTSSAMFPSIAVGAITGNPSLASATLFAQASGNTFIEDINKGNDYLPSLGHSLVVGAVEMASERIFDVPGYFGGGKLDDLVLNNISKGVSKLNLGKNGQKALAFTGYMAMNGFGEAIEEGFAEAIAPTLSNVMLGEKNKSFTAEHWGEIGYASLLGMASAWLMPTSYVSTKAMASGDVAVYNILSGKGTDADINSVLKSGRSLELFSDLTGLEIYNDVAEAQLKAFSESAKAVSGKAMPTEVAQALENIDGNSVAEYVENVSEYLPEFSDEFVATETEAVKEMVATADMEIAVKNASPSEAISKTADKVVADTVKGLSEQVQVSSDEALIGRVASGVASSGDIQKVSKDASLRAKFTDKTGVTLSAVPGEARQQISGYVAEQKKAVSDKFNAGVNSDSDTVVLIPPTNGGQIITTTMGEFKAMPTSNIAGYTVFNRDTSRQIGTVVDIGSAVNAIDGASTAMLDGDRIALIGNDGDVKGISAGEFQSTVADGKYDGYDVFNVAKSVRIGVVDTGHVAEATEEAPAEAVVEEAPAVDEAVDEMVDESENAVDGVAEAPVAEPVVAQADDVAVANDVVAEAVEEDDDIIGSEQEAINRVAAESEYIKDLKRQRDNGEITDEEYRELATDYLLNSEEAQKAYNAGAGSESSISSDLVNKIRSNSISVISNTGKVLKNNSTVKSVGIPKVRAYRAIGNALGVDIKLFDGNGILGENSGVDGMYDRKTRTVYLNATGSIKTLDAVFRHELIHHLAKVNPKAYAEFKNFVVDEYKDKYSEKAFEKWLDSKKAEYSAKGQTLDREDVVEEFMANHGMDMLQDEATVRKLVHTNRNLAQRILEAIRSFFSQFGNKIASYDSAMNTLARVLGEGVTSSSSGITRNYTGGSSELLPESLGLDSLRKAEARLVNAFREVADINLKVEEQLFKEEFASREELENRRNELWEEYGAKVDSGAVMSEGVTYDASSEGELDKAVPKIVDKTVDVMEKKDRVMPSMSKSVDKGDKSVYNKDMLDTVSFEKRYADLTEEEHRYYNEAKKGNTQSSFNLINKLIGKGNSEFDFASVDKNTFLLPVIGAEGTSDNILPSYIAEHFGDEYGLKIFDGIYKSNESNSRGQGVWDRMKENYPSFEIGKNINTTVIKGKKFILIDDNSTTGRTFNGLKNFIEENGGTVVGYYALTVGQDASEKMTVNEDTWKRATDIGIEKLKQFAKEEGVKREISRQGLTERECQELINRWEKRRLSDPGRRTANDRTSSGEAQGVPGVSARDGETGAVQETQRVKLSNSSPVTPKMSEDYNKAIADGDVETQEKLVKEAAEKSGWIPVYRYHQTGKRFTEFSNANPDAGLNDSDTPNGYFLKDNDHDIGVGADYVRTGHGGDIQMKVFLKHDNLLHFENREEAQKWYSKNIDGYKELLDKYNKHLADFEKISKENHDKMFDELTELEESGKSTPALDLEIMEKYDAIIDKWIDANETYSKGLRADMRKLLNKYFLENDSGYDGIELVDDGHRYIDGKREEVHTYIVFKKSQIKSADPVTYDDDGNVIPIEERFNTEKTDIRWSASSADINVNAVSNNGQDKIDKQNREVDKRNKKNYRDADRLADESKRLKFESKVVADSEKIKTVANNIASVLGVNDVSTTEAIGNGLKNIYKLWGEAVTARNTNAGITKLADANKAVSDLAIQIVSGEFASKVEDIAIDDELVSDVSNIVSDIINGKFKANADTEVTKSMVEFTSKIRPLDVQTDMAKKALSDATKSHNEGNGSYKTVKWWRKQVDLYDGLQKSVNEKRKAKRKLRERLSAGLGVPLTAPDSSIPFDKRIEALWQKQKRDSANLALVALDYPLSAAEQGVMKSLVYGNLDISDVKKLDGVKYNVQNILMNAKATIALANTDAVIQDYNTAVRRMRDLAAERNLELLGGINDKRIGNFLRMKRETAERLIHDIAVKKDNVQKVSDYYFKPVHENEFKANELRNRILARVKALKLERGSKKGNLVSESYAVQYIGEVRDNIDYLSKHEDVEKRDGKTLKEWREALEAFEKENPNLDYKKIDRAIAEFTNIYNELFDSINAARTYNGYKPMNYRRGYFPHFKETGVDGLFSVLFKSMGVQSDITELPSTISGMTQNFKPGIRWFNHAQERTGYATAYDAIQGLERYLYGASDVIYHTGDIQRLRSLAKRIRYNASDEGVETQIEKIERNKKLSVEEKQKRINELRESTGSENVLAEKIDAIENDATLTPEEKDERIQGVYQGLKFEGSNFVMWVDEYANILAGKKALADRNSEYNLGRKMYNVVKKYEGRTAANMIVSNVSSYVTNFIPLVQATLTSKSIARGMIGTLRSIAKSDIVSTSSVFLNNRIGSESLNLTTGAKVVEALMTPMTMIDNFTTGTIVRARYYDNLKLGMSTEDALAEADDMAARIMADRSKGSMPLLFEEKNPFTKLFTVFQLEVNNQVSFFTKDYAKEARERGVARIAAKTLEYGVAAWLFNQIFKMLFGREPAFDPIDIVNDTVGGFVGKKLPDLDDMLKEFTDGDDVYWTPEEVENHGITKGTKELVTGIAENLPFLSFVNLFGLELDNARLPVSSSMPDIPKIFTAAFNENYDARKKASVIGKEVLKPLYYVAMPFGGGALKKFIEGVQAYNNSGSYKIDNDGNKVMQYPIFTDEGTFKSVMTFLKATMFGKSSFDTAVDWVDSDFKNALNADATSAYLQFKDSEEVTQRDLYNFLKELTGIKKDTEIDGVVVTDDASANAKKRALLMQSGLPDEIKAAIYAGVLLSGTDEDDADEIHILSKYADDNLSEVYHTLSLMADCGTKTTEKKRIIWNSNLSDEQKLDIMETVLYNFGKNEDWISESEKIEAFNKLGLGINDYLQVYIKRNDINNKYDGNKDITAAEKRDELATWLVKNYTVTQAESILDILPFSSGTKTGSKGSTVLELAKKGVSADKFEKISSALAVLKPLKGADEVSVRQKVKAIDGVGLTKEERINAYYTVLPSNSSEGKKLEYLVNNHEGKSFKVDYYFEMKEIGNRINKNMEVNTKPSGMTNAECDAAIIELAEKHPELTKETKAALWQLYTGSSSSANNPYGTKIGDAVIKAMGWKKK